MEHDVHVSSNQPKPVGAKTLTPPPEQPRKPERGHEVTMAPWSRILIGVVVCGLSVGILWVFQHAPINVTGTPATSPVIEEGKPLAKWKKPELAIILSGQNFGYILPCGCSEPQYGGLARRYNFIQTLKEKGWPVVGLDLGDFPGKKRTPQRVLKHAYAMKALNLMGYRATTIGLLETEANTVLEYTLNNKNEPPVVVANLDPKGLIAGLEVTKPWKLIEEKGHPAVAVLGMVGDDVRKEITNKQNYQFLKGQAANARVLEETLKSIGTKSQGKTPITVLLYQGGYDGARACAQYCAKLRTQHPKLPRLDVLLCLSDEVHAEPPGTPVRVKGTPTQIIRVGWKGKYVGVLGVFADPRNKDQYRFEYELVLMSPKFAPTKKDAVRNAVIKVFSEYAKIVKDEQHIKHWGTFRHPTQVALPKLKPHFVGSSACRACHISAYKIWKKSAHSHAFQTLVDLKDKPHKYPPHREHDAECVKCHVVGFEYKTGYQDLLNDEKPSDLVKSRLVEFQRVGCESCHGPASMHVADSKNEAYYPLINPWKAKPGMTKKGNHKRLLQISVACQKCHDPENDVNYNFEKRWAKVVHMTPK